MEWNKIAVMLKNSKVTLGNNVELFLHENILEKLKKDKNYERNLYLLSVFNELYKYNVNGDKEKKILYLLESTKTGRLKTSSDSFTILNLKKEKRKEIISSNGFFLSLDYNAAELRTVLGLNGIIQPEIDIHVWNSVNMFDNLSREESKKNIFKWLYNPDLDNQKIEKVYNRELICNKYYD